MKNEGEYIPLIYEGRPESFFIRGHIPAKTAMLILAGEDVLDSGYHDYKTPEWEWVDTIAILSPAMHRYARWSIEPGPDGCTQVLRDYKDPGRGRFKVTQFDVIEWKQLS